MPNATAHTVAIVALISGLSSPHAMAQSTGEEARLSALEQRLHQLEYVNERLLRMLEAERSEPVRIPSSRPVPHRTTVIDPVPKPAAEPVTASPSPTLRGRQSTDVDFVSTSSKTSFKVLDHAENVNTKPLLQLQAKQGEKFGSKVVLSGAATVLANYQRSTSDSKFGYLMRNPTSANQVGKDVSEAVIHSAQLSTTALLTDSLTAYIELLYNPEQSFGSGTITDLNRNQVQVRRAYFLLGDLERSPLYAAIGKMDTPFGLNATVNPFTNSTNWHAFAGLAYGAQAGYFANGLHVRAMAIQGGAQFRAANVPVEGTNVPSRLNNFAVDANYTYTFADDVNALIGASYTHGSPYCQDYPVFHFNPCSENVPAYAVYGTANVGPLEILGELAETTEVWPGTAVPDPTNPLSIFDARKATAWTAGTRYGFDTALSQMPDDLLVSFEFSRFISGEDGAPWERQNQYVAGVSQYLAPNVNLFGEYVHVDGFVPLNFLSGGNFPDGSSWSERDAETDVFLLGIQAAF